MPYYKKQEHGKLSYSVPFYKQLTNKHIGIKIF